MYISAYLALPGLCMIPPNALPGGKRLVSLESKWNPTFPAGKQTAEPPGSAFSLAVRNLTV